MLQGVGAQSAVFTPTLRSPFSLITMVVAGSLLVACTKEGDDETKKTAADYLSELQAWRNVSDVSVESLASLRALYMSNALENLRSDYDGSPLAAVVIEINQNNSISIWVETTRSREGIVSRFREDSNGYEGRSDAEILENITPWYYDAFKYACLELSCTGEFKVLAEADWQFCENGLNDDDGGGLGAVSREATIDAILLLESSNVLTEFARSPDFEVRVFSDENDTISPGKHCWRTNKALVRRREQTKS